MTSTKDFTKRVFATSKIMTAVAVTLIVVGGGMTLIAAAGWLSKQQKEQAVEQLTNQSASDTSSSSSSSASTTQPSASPSTAKTYTAAEVAQHASQSDCWMIMSGEVYNLSDFMNQHPGGVQSMLPYCGKDGTQAFATQDRGARGGHSQTASDLRAQYKIGALAN